MRPYSEDLWERIVRAVEGGMSRNAAAKHQQRSQTHASTTDPEARLYRKANGSSRMAFMGHVLMENCYGLVVGVLFHPDHRHTAEREAALALVDRLKATGRVTLGRTTACVPSTTLGEFATCCWCHLTLPHPRGRTPASA